MFRNQDLFNAWRTNDSWRVLGYAPFAGGTYSSHSLEKWVGIQSKLENPSFYPALEYDYAKDVVNKAVKVWQEALTRHNAQPLRYFTYDVSDGKTLDENPNYDRNLMHYLSLKNVDALAAHIYIVNGDASDDAVKESLKLTAIDIYYRVLEETKKQDNENAV